MEKLPPFKPEMDKSNEPIVLFDVDNTLVKGFTIFHFANHLAKNNFIRLGTPQLMDEDHTFYDNGEFSYEEFAKTVVDHYYQGLAGFSQNEIEAAGVSYLKEYKEKLFPYAVTLAKIMNIQGKTIVVSGAPREAFSPMADYLKITESHLLEGEIVEGYFSGKTKVNMALGMEKAKVISKITEGGYLKGKSFAFGDSASDGPILVAVSNPFVVSPKAEFAKEVIKNGWPIVESNNIIKKVSQRMLDLDE